MKEIENLFVHVAKRAIFEVIKEIDIKNIIKDDDFPEVMTTKQLAAYLQCSVPWLTSNIKALKIPFKFLGKEYRFFKEEINSWIKEQDTNKNEKVSIVLTNKKDDLKII